MKPRLQPVALMLFLALGSVTQSPNAATDLSRCDEKGHFLTVSLEAQGEQLSQTLWRLGNEQHRSFDADTLKLGRPMEIPRTTPVSGGRTNASAGRTHE